MTLHATTSLSFVAIGALVAVPCDAGSQTARPGGRTFAAGSWVEVARVADEAGRLLTDPIMIAGRGDTAYVYDAGTQELVALGRTGALWRAGRAGKGPREFSSPVDLRVAPNGDIHVLDPDVSRITIVDLAGRVVDMRRVEERLHRIVPRRFGWWAVSLGRPDLLIALNGDGRLAPPGAVRSPPDIASRHILAREPFVVPMPNGGALVGFVWASRLIFVDANGRVDVDMEGPEHVPFAEIRNYSISLPQKATVQRVDPKARVAARDITANDTMALVLFGGSTRDRGKLVDRYDLRTRRYVESARLPRQPAMIRLVGNSLLALERDPAPAVVWYEWRSHRAR